MKREEKALIISSLSEKLKEYSHYYLADISGLNAEKTAQIRKECFEIGIVLTVVKNTLFKAALTENNIAETEIVNCLVGQSAIMFSNVGSAPAKLIAKYQKTGSKPSLKAAWVEECAYVGADNLKVLESIKSHDELVGDIIGMLQSPIKNVVSALQSSGHTLSGLVKTLSERGE